MDMTVEWFRNPPSVWVLMLFILIGEVLEKATRVLSEEDRIMMDQEFVGRNGEKRKIEVGFDLRFSTSIKVCEINLGGLSVRL